MSDFPITTRAMKVQGRAGAGLSSVLIIEAVPTFVERIVPPAGEAHAFNVQHYRRRVEVSVSPSGRSVRVFVDGEEVK